MNSMQFKIVCSMVFMLGQGAPSDDKSAVSEKFEVEDFHLNENGEGKYSFDFHTSNGIHHQQTGRITPGEESNSELVVRGSYSYITPEGFQYTINYIADKNGFRPGRVHFHVPAASPKNPVVAFEYGEDEKISPKSQISSTALGSLVGAGLG